MDQSTGRDGAIHHLLASLAEPDPASLTDLGLADSLTRLVAALKRVTPSYRGLAIALVMDGRPVRLTLAEPSSSGAVSTSLSMSLSWVPALAEGSRITFYAAVPGSFIDLAADLAFTLGSVDLWHDDDLPPILASDLTDLRELLVLEKAVGILLDHGHTPDSARRLLARAAEAAGTSSGRVAEAVLDDPSGERWTWAPH